jgi:hypothetical protein
MFAAGRLKRYRRQIPPHQRPPQGMTSLSEFASLALNPTYNFP